MAVLCDLFRGSLRNKKDFCNRETQYQKQQVAAESEKYAVHGHAVGGICFFLTERPGNQRVHTDGDTGRQSDQKVLHWECHRNGCERILTDPRHENTVYYIVERLHKHGDHHRQRHRHQKPVYRHDAHLVFFSCDCLFFTQISSLRF